MAKIYIVDVTNRDGVQTSRICLSKLQKTMINIYLDEMGIYQSEFGFPTTNHEINYLNANLELAKKGALRIEWASKNMPVLNLIKQRFSKEKPLKGLKVACCLHVTTETAVLADVLKTGGAEAYLCASNPLSTQDDVAASLVNHLKVAVLIKLFIME